jgi:uncharacterized protein YjiS (DUF1127 family)
MSCANRVTLPAVNVRPPSSVEMDWPWPDWFRDIAPALARIWQKRRERQALLELDERMLRDIGVSREQAQRQAAKWFWQ